MTTQTPEAYVPPKVWHWDQNAGGRFAKINRPIAGATHEQELPKGKHDLQLYSLATPNGIKIPILLEELIELGHKEAEYDAWFTSIDGPQFGSGFVEVNPNSKIPALYDYSVKTKEGKPLRVFESGSILLYLADKYKALIPQDIAGRTETLNWLFWQIGSAPFVGGGFGHFYAYAPVKLEYPINRYALETKRQLDVLNIRLGEVPWIAGDEYTIADIAIFSWYGLLVEGNVYGAGEFLDVKSYTNVVKWAEKIAARPAVKRGRLVNKGEGGLKDRHDESDFNKLQL